MVFATLAFLGAFGADQGLLTYFADLSGPALRYCLMAGRFKCVALLVASKTFNGKVWLGQIGQPGPWHGS